jgi:hypothetical protein
MSRGLSPLCTTTTFTPARSEGKAVIDAIDKMSAAASEKTHFKPL